MSYHIVSKANGPYRPGTWFECDDIGCIKVEPVKEGNRIVGAKEIGVLIPRDQVIPYVTCVGKGSLRRHGR